MYDLGAADPGAAGSGVADPAAAGSGAPARPAPVRLGVLGCAAIAWRKTLPAVLAEPGLRLVAVGGRDPAKTERFARRFGCLAVAGYQALLDRPDIDAVYVPLPVGLRHRWVAAALAAGKHVLAEKPLVGTEKEAADLVEQARAAGRTLMENIAFLLHGQHRAVRAVQDAEQLGELRVFSSAFGIPPLRPGNIRYRPELGGGALLDVGFYPLRAAQLFLGPDLRVIGAELRTGAAGVDVAGSVLLAAPGGASVQLSFGFEHFYRNEYELWCSAGRVGLTRAFTPPPEHRPALRIERDGRVETRSLAPEDQFGHLARVFATVVTNRADLRAHHEDVIAHARLLDAVRAHTGMAGR